MIWQCRQQMGVTTMLNETKHPSAPADEKAVDRPAAAADENTADRPSSAPGDQGNFPPTGAPETDARASGGLWREPTPEELFLVLAPEMEELLGPPPLIPGEDRETYTKLLLGVAQAVQPRELVEWISVQEVADCAPGITGA